MKDLACTYHSDTDTWRVRVPFALSDEAIERVRVWLLGVQVDRDRGLPPGDKKDLLKRAIFALEQRKIVQIHVGTGDIVVYQSTERTRPDRLILDMGAKN